MNQLTKYCHYCGQEQCICAQGTTSSSTANPTPQPHADDVKLAEAIHSHIWPFVSYQDDTIRSLQVIITQVTQPLRLSNEALRERVKELESALHRINDTICIHHNDAERATLKGDCRICQNNKLTAASEVIEKCDRALKSAIKPLSEMADIDSETRAGWGHKAVDEALRHVAKWKTP